MFASRTLDDCKQLQLGASTRCALRESRYPMGGRDPEFRCVCTCVRDCTRRVRHRVAACAPGSGDPAPGVFLGGRNCGVLCHCDEPTSEGGCRGRVSDHLLDDGREPRSRQGGRDGSGVVGSWRDIRIGLNGALRGVGDAAEETDTGPGSWAPTVAADITRCVHGRRTRWLSLPLGATRRLEPGGVILVRLVFVRVFRQSAAGRASGKGRREPPEGALGR